MSIQSRLNRILTLAATTATAVALAIAPLPVTAAATTDPTPTTDAPHAADENASSLTLTVTQFWTRNYDDIDMSATYELIPETTSHQEGYTSDTAAAVQAGLIQFQIGDGEVNDGAFTLTGDEVSTDIVYHWTSPGLYVFRLQGTSEYKEHYTYDGGYYLIRVYVRSDGDSFITAENEAGEKVAEITVDPQYYIEDNHHHHDDETPSPVRPVTPTQDETVTPITPDDVENPDAIDESDLDNNTNHQNAYTGDASNMTLYGAVTAVAAIALIAWTIRHKHTN